MSTFLAEVAQQIKYNPNEKICCVVPSGRAANELKKHLITLNPGTSILPKIATFNVLVDEYVSTYSTNKLFIEHALYQAYKAKTSDEKPSNFEHFQLWGNSLLQDFNEVVRQLQNPAEVFKNLADYKDIEHWSHAQEYQGEIQLKFNKFWSDIPIIFEQFAIILKEKNWATAAMQQADLAKNFTALNSTSEKVYFIGFNAFSKAEEEIVEHFIALGGKAFWDVSSIFSQHKNNEAYKFIAPYKGKEGHIFVEHNALEQEKNLTIHNTPLELGQVFIAADILRNLSAEELSQTVLILPKEVNLQALLNALPDNVKLLNITMGLSLEQNPFFPILKNILTLYTQLAKEVVESQLIKNTLTVFKVAHPSIATSTIFSIESPTIEQSLVKQAFEDLPITFDFFKGISDKSKSLDLIKTLPQITSLLQCLAKGSKQSAYTHIKSAIAKTQNTLLNIIDALEEELSLNQTTDLIINNIKQEQIDIIGDPGLGLQIMGMLETRALDYKRIIFLDTNEGAMPPKITENSLIPFDLKKYYNLNLPDHKQAIFAYYFMRLLNRSTDIHLIHNNLSEGLTSGEMSRYIRSLKFIATKFKSAWTINTNSWAKSIQNQNTEEKVISFTNEQKHLFLKSSANKISASALNSWFTCKRNFYNNYLLNIKEPSKTGIDAATFGEIIHKALEVGFKHIIDEQGGILKTTNYPQIEMKTLAALPAAFEEFAPFLPNTNTGEAKLKMDIAKEQLKSFLTIDKTRIANAEKAGVPVQLLSLEQKDTKQIGEITYDGITYPIGIVGFMDRVEKHQDHIKIIDYKTGKVVPQDLLIKNPESIYRSEKMNGKARQLLFYGALFNNAHNLPISSNIYSFVNMKSGLLFLNEKGKEILVTKNLSNDVSQEIIATIEDILSTETIEHNPKAKYCAFCD